MLAITVLLAPTVKNWWDQRQQIAQLQEDIRTKQADQDELKKQIVRWHDPAYVQQQARDRINMVMPGEIGYWVFGKEGGTAGVSAPEGATAPVPGDTPWTQKFLDSVREATK
ncbi:septum formation initiator family protein [Arthrobacter woluwensis]|nr:septum formation initiator family protein [Arthrobacter woluwensis]